MSTKSVKRRVAPLEHIVRLEGHVAQIKQECKRVGPLEHVVRLEGRVTIFKSSKLINLVPRKLCLFRTWSTLK
jgi:hypothetical protein